MIIIQLNAAYALSSTGRTTQEMHEYLLSKGYESFVFCPQINQPDNHIYRIGNEMDHKLHGMCSLLFGRQGEYSPCSTRKMLKKWDKIKPDVVILRNMHANYVNIPMVLNYLAEKNIATVNVLHDFFSMTGHCCHYVIDNCKEWMTECHDCPILYKYNRSLFLDRSRHCFKNKMKGWQSIPRLTVIGVSNWSRDEAIKSPMFKNAYSIKRIYNWVDVDCFRPQDTSDLRTKLNIKADDFVVLGVAQWWTESKGLSKFFRAADSLPDCKFVIIGRMRDNNIHYPENVIRVGVVEDFVELSRYYSMSNVFLNFSVVETFGKVMAEALASGCPIICNNTTAIPELCGEGCGYVMQNGTWEEARDGIKKIQSNSRDFYKEKCRRFALDNFEREQGLKQYEDLFKRIIA